MPEERSPTVRLFQTRPRLPGRWWLAVLLILIVVVAAIGVIRIRREERSVTYYACFSNGVVTQVARTKPTACPPGSVVARGSVLVIGREEAIGQTGVSELRSHLTIPAVMIALATASLVWILAGWRIEESWLLVAWLLVPLFAFVSAACVAGPGRWFPKEPYEGASIVPLGASDAITVLDVLGLTIASLTLLSAVLLIRYRWRQRRALEALR